MKNLLKVENLKKTLYDSVNNSELSIVEVYYIVKDLYKEIVDTYNKALKEAYENEEKEKVAEKVEDKEE